ncbi:MAG: J domain-containing protein [Cyanobacteria bacterium P01_F01_bin.3]
MRFQRPLQWPAMKPRTPEYDRRAGRFSRASRNSYGQRPITLNEACQRLEEQIDAWTRVGHNYRIDPDDVVVTSDIVKIRADGYPYSNQRMPKDPAIAVYFILDDEPRVLAVDSLDSIEQNIAVAAKILHNRRDEDRYGVSLDQGGIMRLQLPETSSASAWWNVLDVPADADPKAVRKAYLALAKEHHPDQAPQFNPARWKRIQTAYEQAGKP